ncbi:MAG: hypothetical protein ACR2GY_01260 [Phycisphaerales bacterium]
MDDIQPAVIALRARLTDLLGDPRPETNEKITIWKPTATFEVAMQRDVGPHIWIPAMWWPRNQPVPRLNQPDHLHIEEYLPTQPRHSGLGTAQMLNDLTHAFCIKNVVPNIGQAIALVRRCAIDAGVLDGPDVVITERINQNERARNE